MIELTPADLPDALASMDSGQHSRHCAVRVSKAKAAPRCDCGASWSPEELAEWAYDMLSSYDLTGTGSGPSNREAAVHEDLSLLVKARLLPHNTAAPHRCGIKQPNYVIMDGVVPCQIVTHVFSDDELADVWSKHLSVSISPMGACRSVNADALRAMREVEQMTAARIREADTAHGITEMREILADIVWVSRCELLDERSTFTLSEALAAMRAVASRTRPATPAPDARKERERC